MASTSHPNWSDTLPAVYWLGAGADQLGSEVLPRDRCLDSIGDCRWETGGPLGDSLRRNADSCGSAGGGATEQSKGFNLVHALLKHALAKVCNHA
jgi:hypothetical protein